MDTRRRTRNLSLQPVEDRAAIWLANRLTRGNISAFVAGLIVKAAREEIGRDWAEVVMDERPFAEEAAA